MNYSVMFVTLGIVSCLICLICLVTVGVVCISKEKEKQHISLKALDGTISCGVTRSQVIVRWGQPQLYLMKNISDVYYNIWLYEENGSIIRLYFRQGGTELVGITVDVVGL